MAAIPQSLLDAYARDSKLLGPEAAARSLPANYQVVNGKIQVRPDPWLLKYGWTIPLAIEAAGPAIAAMGGGGAGAGVGGAPAVMTGPTLAQATAAVAPTAGAGATMAGTGNWKDIADLGAKLFGNIWATHAQTSAADKSAQIAADSAKYGADKVAAAEAAALAFQKSTGENAYQNSEVGRRTDYGWNVAREHRLGYLGDLLGMPQREIPDYIPGVDPHFDGSAGGGLPPGAETAGAGGAYSPTASDAPKDPAAINAALQSFYKSVGKTPTGPGSGPTDIAYFAGRVGQTGGLTPDNINYWFGPKGRIAQELAATVQPEASAAGAFRAPTAQRAPIVVPFLSSSPSASGSFGSFL